MKTSIVLSAVIFSVVSSAFTFTHISLRTSRVNQFESFAEGQATQDNLVAYNGRGAGNNNQPRPRGD